MTRDEMSAKEKIKASFSVYRIFYLWNKQTLARQVYECFIYQNESSIFRFWDKVIY